MRFSNRERRYIDQGTYFTTDIIINYGPFTDVLVNVAAAVTVLEYCYSTASHKVALLFRLEVDRLRGRAGHAGYDRVNMGD